MDIIESLKWRYAVKMFDPEKRLNGEQLERITDGIQLTPTSMGLQLMRFLIISDPVIKSDLVPLAYNQQQLKDCSHVIVLCRKSVVSEEDITSLVQRTGEVRQLESDHPTLFNYEKMLRKSLSLSPVQQIAWMENQVYIALGNLLTVCAADKIDACPMEGFDRQKVDSYLKLPEKGLNAVVLCPVGFRSENDKYRKISKVRRRKSSLFEFV
ncbi:MAG: nitroreductase family protein [Brumimicrobium sp.]|nr:nitroreductase family protein [Brumimicrobium sp.]